MVVAIIFILVTLSYIYTGTRRNRVVCSVSGIFSSLSSSVGRDLRGVNISLKSFSGLTGLSFRGMVNRVLSLTLNGVSSPLGNLIGVATLLLLYSMVDTCGNSLSYSVSGSLGVATALYVAYTTMIPTIKIVTSANSMVYATSGVVLTCIPIVTMVVTDSNSITNSTSCCTMVVKTKRNISRLSSGVVIPLLGVFLNLSVASSMSPSMGLDNFVSVVSGDMG